MNTHLNRALGAAAVVGLLALGACSDTGTEVTSPEIVSPDLLIFSPGPGTNYPRLRKVQICKEGSSATFRVSTSSGSAPADFTVADGECIKISDDMSHGLTGLELTIEEIAAQAGFQFASLVVYEISATVDAYKQCVEPVTTTQTVVTDPSYTVTGTECNGFLFVFKNEPKADGCTPGAWKNRLLNIGAWVPTGLSPDQSVGSLFANAPASLAGATLLEALEFDGGPTFDEKVALLIHHAVAAALNAGHPGINYPYTQAEVIAMTNAAIASGDADIVEAQKDEFDDANNAGCSL